jgi:hypothetical protein
LARTKKDRPSITYVSGVAQTRHERCHFGMA